MAISENVKEFAGLPVVAYHPAVGLVLPTMPRREFRSGRDKDFWAITLEGDYFHGLAGRRDLRSSPGSPPSFVRTNTEDEESSGGDVLMRWTRDLGKDSNFVKFCALVSAVAGVTLGRDVIRRVVSPKASANRKPAGS